MIKTSSSGPHLKALTTPDSHCAILRPAVYLHSQDCHKHLPPEVLLIGSGVMKSSICLCIAEAGLASQGDPSSVGEGSSEIAQVVNAYFTVSSIWHCLQGRHFVKHFGMVLTSYSTGCWIHGAKMAGASCDMGHMCWDDCTASQYCKHLQANICTVLASASS